MRKDHRPVRDGADGGRRENEIQEGEARQTGFSPSIEIPSARCQILTCLPFHLSLQPSPPASASYGIARSPPVWFNRNDIRRLRGISVIRVSLPS